MSLFKHNTILQKEIENINDRLRNQKSLSNETMSSKTANIMYTGTFLTKDDKTVTVINGLIKSVS